MIFKAAVIGDACPEFSAIAALMRRAGIPTKTIWSGKMKKQLAAVKDCEVVVICQDDKIFVRDMILRDQRLSSLHTIRHDLADAFDGYLMDDRDWAITPTNEAMALKSINAIFVASCDKILSHDASEAQ